MSLDTTFDTGIDTGIDTTLDTGIDTHADDASRAELELYRAAFRAISDVAKRANIRLQ